MVLWQHILAVTETWQFSYIGHTSKSNKQVLIDSCFCFNLLLLSWHHGWHKHHGIITSFSILFRVAGIVYLSASVAIASAGGLGQEEIHPPLFTTVIYIGDVYAYMYHMWSHWHQPCDQNCTHTLKATFHVTGIYHWTNPNTVAKAQYISNRAQKP